MPISEWSQPPRSPGREAWPGSEACCRWNYRAVRLVFEGHTGGSWSACRWRCLGRDAVLFPSRLAREAVHLALLIKESAHGQGPLLGSVNLTVVSRVIFAGGRTR